MAKKKDSETKQSGTKYKTPLSYMLIAIFAILFVFQEILFRVIFPIPEVLNFNRINYSPVFFSKSDTELKYLSNASFIWASDPDGAESLIKLNIYGFRGKDFCIKPKADVPRIAFLGDSFAEGYMVEENQTIPAVFDAEAKQNNRKMETLNLGIGGNDFLGYCKLLGDVVPLLKPAHVVIILHANDLPPQPYTADWFDKPAEPEFSHWWVPRMYYVLSNLIHGKTVPHRWMGKPFTFFAPVPAPSNPWSNTEKAGIYEKFITPKIATAMKNGRFNPFSVDEYSQFKEHLPQTFKITEHLNGIQNFMAQYGGKIYLVYVPSRTQVNSYYLQYQKEFSSDSALVPLTGDEYQIHAKIMKSSCQSLGIPFLDCTDIIKAEENAGKHLYWNYDEHMRPEGYALIGKAIYSWWKTEKNIEH